MTAAGAGTAVFPHLTTETAPLAMRANVEHNHVLHEQVVIVSMRPENVPHVAAADRLSLDELGYTDDGIVHLTARFGFQDRTDIPEALRQACARGLLPRRDVDGASYFLSRITLRFTDAPGMRRWRKHLFIGLAHNAASQAITSGYPPTGRWSWDHRRHLTGRGSRRVESRPLRGGERAQRWVLEPTYSDLEGTGAAVSG